MRARTIVPHPIAQTSDRRAGFTLIEALVALAVIAAFAGALGPHLFSARRILTSGNGRVTADLLLRSLIQAPFDRNQEAGVREGVSNGLRWRIVVEPIFLDTPIFDDPEPAEDPKDAKDAKDAKNAPKWAAYRVNVRVLWGEGQAVAAETIRLAKAQ
jgi:prepilin-type N-terminal cleavage/methylation domain-containing protein